MNARPLVSVEQVSRAYGQTQAIADISFSVSQGEVLGFLGPNGAGKSTTMQIITGNLAPSHGRVSIAGFDLAAQPREAKQHLGYLPEHPPVYREFSVDEFLDYCAALRRIPRKERKAARETAKAKCGLADVGRRLIGNLSKGYQQRVGLAQAIIHLPPLIVLDEPTVGLDPNQIRDMRTLIRELGRNHGVILSTHILSEAQATCDRVQIINKGRLVLSEGIDDLARQVRTRALLVAFRQAPDVNALQALPGVEAVEPHGNGRLRISHGADHDPADAIVQLAAARQWGLYEINPERADLEALFVQLTGDAVENGA
jgi:ABC-2 type transport system ATP-binding protein